MAGHMRGLGREAMPQYVATPRQLYMKRPAYRGLHHGSLEVADPLNQRA